MTPVLQHGAPLVHIKSQITSYIPRMEERLFGLTTSDIKVLAFQLASRNGILNPFSKEDERAGSGFVDFLSEMQNLPYEHQRQLMLHEPGALIRQVW